MPTAYLKADPSEKQRLPGVWRALAIVRVELRLKRRNRALPFILALIAGCCVLLTPTAAMDYAIITFNEMKPIMSADTSIVTAGAVFGILTFPIYLLGLGAGYSRDARLAVGRLLASSPVAPGIIFAARLAANCISVVVVALAVFILLSITALSRFGALPGVFSMIIYLLISIPVGLLAVPISGLIDRYLTNNHLAKTAAALAVWFLFILGSLTLETDIFGVFFLRQSALPGDSGNHLSVGFISAQNLATIPWKSLEIAPRFVLMRVWLMVGALIVSAIASFLARSGAVSGLARSPQKAEIGEAKHVYPSAPPQATVAPVTPVRASGVLLRRWLRRAKWIWGLMLLSFLLSLALSHKPRAALATAFVIPLVIFNSSRIRADKSLRSLELTTPGLWFPSPALFSAMVLASLTMAPALFVLGHLPLARAVHVVIGMALAATWLSWTCVSLSRPLFGVSIYSIAWYLAAFNDLPASIDLLGISGSATVSMAVAISLSIILAALIVHSDRGGPIPLLRKFRS